ncbi:class II fructose-bisphosphate aldolase [Candidatus Merdisoma sp. JLR.KK006]|jgi:fructose/tagatose bisphosphate aldolase|uniref:class II fructose-bisphosphate aldolase n=1 Tax=Candidatus Merdisoma sp. JLR.KK006 TaxID=3112626 RepID=UPI002FF42ED3
MPIITKRQEVLKIYEDAAEKGWVIPCLCTENLTTTEAIIEAASEFAKDHGLKSVPVTLAITVQYDHRSQSRNYTHSRNWETGLKLFKADAEVLMRKGGDYDNVDLLLHLDHVQHDLDEELCESDLSEFSTIMYDASNLPLEENIAKTRRFVEKKGQEIMIEGACDEIVDAGGEAHNDITTADKCADYMKRTGVDMVVANLGTEHRASGKDLQYHGEAAKAIRKLIGPKIVLHGTSSVSNEQVRKLFGDGVCKVNIWTALERDASPELVEFLVHNASKAAGPDMAAKLIREGYLTEKCATGEKESLTAFTTVARQDVIFRVMKRMVREYLDMWYVF